MPHSVPGSPSPDFSTLSGSPPPGLGSWRQRLPALAVGIAGLLLSLWTYWALEGAAESQLRQRFEQSATDRIIHLQNLLDRTAEILDATGGLFDASNMVDREAFRRFASPFLDRHPEILALQWIRVVDATERPAYEKQMREEGFAPQGIVDTDALGHPVAALADRGEYLPITFAEPLSAHRQVIGLDVQRRPAATALWQAVAEGHIRSSAPFTLMQDLRGTQAIALYRPVYRPEMPIATPEQRRQALAGVAALLMRPAQTLESMLDPSAPHGVDIDLLAPESTTPIYRHTSRMVGAGPRDPSLAVRLPIRLPGQQWEVLFEAREGFRHSQPERYALPVLGIGLAFTTVIVFLLLTGVRQTNRSRALASELEITNRRLNQAQQIGRIGNWELDVKSGRLWWSAEIFRIFGLDPACFDATYEHFLDVIHPDDREMVNDAYHASLASREPYDIVHRLLLPDGKVKFVRERCETAYRESGEPWQSSGTIQDITEWHLAEQAMRENEARFRAVFEQAGGGIAFADRDGRLLMVNDAFCGIVGYSREMLCGRSFAEITHPEDVSEESAAFSQAVAGQREGYRLEKRYLTRQGEARWVDLSVTVGRDDEEQPLFFVGMAFDITARKEAEQLLKESRHRFEDLVNTTDGIVWEADAQSFDFTFVSRKAEELLGYPLEAWYRPGFWAEHIHPEDREEAVSYCRTATEALRPHQFEYRFLTRDGNTLWLQDIVAVVAEAGRPIRLRGLIVDITRLKETEERLRLFAKVFENSGEAILVTDRQARILNVNHAFTRLTGYTADEVLGKNPHILASGREGAAFYTEMWRNLKQEGSWQGEIWDRRKDGEVYPKWLSISALRNTRNEVTHYIGSFIDISQIKNAEASIRFLAHHDPLTGLPNRFTLQARLTQTLADARRFHHSVAVLFLDLDRFKTINDSLGHQVGDQLLIEVAHRLGSSLRETDTIARLGGDEFVVVLPHIIRPLDAAEVARKLVEILSEPMRLPAQTLHTSPSIGVSLFPGDGEEMETLLKNADTAMYHAKAQGRGTYQFFKPEMNEAARLRLSLENDLRLALEREEFSLHFQPQFNLGTGRLAGLEALLRWQQPERGSVSPAKFIPIAEESGLILRIGDWVLREACRLARQWHRQGILDVPLAVNVSARQFRQRDFAERVRLVLDESHLEARLLELEITESAIMEHEGGATDTLHRLHESGVRMAIDDFGTGYSSLAYLKSFPLHKLKIDRSFIRDIERSANDAAISFAIIGLAHNLGLQVVAEGIETEGQLKLLRSHGCDTGQGFLLGHGVPAAEIETLLSRLSGSGTPLPPHAS